MHDYQFFLASLHFSFLFTTSPLQQRYALSELQITFFASLFFSFLSPPTIVLIVIQKEILEKFFQKSQYITRRLSKKLSEKLNKPERSIRVWFQNRRVQLRSEVDELDKSSIRIESTQSLDTQELKLGSSSHLSHPFPTPAGNRLETHSDQAHTSKTSYLPSGAFVFQIDNSSSDDLDV